MLSELGVLLRHGSRLARRIWMFISPFGLLTYLLAWVVRVDNRLVIECSPNLVLQQDLSYGLDFSVFLMIPCSVRLVSFLQVLICPGSSVCLSTVLILFAFLVIAVLYLLFSTLSVAWLRFYFILFVLPLRVVSCYLVVFPH
ncbi:hypothetical protein VNO78_02921 [Psophocarpus tetragonolobus]|uniref:Transmembrane protein n=1 Tax=Psophocarpus tetragonolobus TaxID=3891 RepID=A0AAN9T3F2_PSOTE